MTRSFRTEHDSLGPVDVSNEALWGAQTERSLRNFAISNEQIPAELIHALALIKQGCAAVNARHGVLSQELADMIISAAMPLQQENMTTNSPSRSGRRGVAPKRT